LTEQHFSVDKKYLRNWTPSHEDSPDGLGWYIGLMGWYCMGVFVRGASSTYVRNCRTTLPNIWPYFPEVRAAIARASHISSVSQPSATAATGRRSALLAMITLARVVLLNQILYFSSSSLSMQI
jgi:hypothetical protein